MNLGSNQACPPRLNFRLTAFSEKFATRERPHPTAKCATRPMDGASAAFILRPIGRVPWAKLPGRCVGDGFLEVRERRVGEKPKRLLIYYGPYEPRGATQRPRGVHAPRACRCLRGLRR